MFVYLSTLHVEGFDERVLAIILDEEPWVGLYFQPGELTH